MPFGTFPKIHPFWCAHPSLRKITSNSDKRKSHPPVIKSRKPHVINFQNSVAKILHPKLCGSILDNNILRPKVLNHIFGSKLQRSTDVKRLIAKIEYFTLLCQLRVFREWMVFWWWCVCYVHYRNSQPPPAGGSKSMSGFCKSKVR